MTQPDDLRPGDRVALRLPGTTAYVETVTGLLAAGVFPVPLDPRLTAAELEPILADMAPRLVVDDPDELERLHSAYPVGLPMGRPMHVTSGTTGRPKAVFSGLLDPDAADAMVAEERDLWGFRSDDVNLVLSPIHHSAPLRFAMGTLLAGGRLTFPDRSGAGGLDPAAVTRLIEEERPTTVFCVPTHLQRLFAHWDDVGVPDLSSFRLLAHAGAACPPDVKRRLVEMFPDGTTWEFYGSTEGQFTACRSEEWSDRPGTVGRARAGRELVVDDDGTIWCRVPEHARFSYFGAPEKTAAAWRDGPDGPAFTVGDLGRLDDEGYLFLNGRREDLVISGGVNVYPVEVENAMREHLGIDDIAVFGVPDDEWGHRVCAAVVGTATESELAAFARERLSPAKRPRSWRFVDDLPRTSTGKVRRVDLGPGWAVDVHRRHALSFGTAAGAYAAHRPDYAPAAVRWALEPAPGPRVLDLGAGTGKLTGALVALGADVSAVEPDPAMRDELRRALPAVRVLPGSAEAIPLPDASVDAVLAGNALHWFDMALAGPEIARVLAPGGILAGLWNVVDDRVDWVAGLARVSGSAAIGARDTLSSWRVATAGQVARFGSPEPAEFPHGQRRTAESLVATLATRAGVLVMPEPEREATLGRISAFLATRPETARGEFTLPMLTGVLRVQPRESPPRGDRANDESRTR